MIASILHLGKSGIPKKVCEEGRGGGEGRGGEGREKEKHILFSYPSYLTYTTPHTLTAHHRG